MKQFILRNEPDRHGQIRLEGGDYRYLVRVRRLAVGEYFPAALPDGGAVMVRVCSIDNQSLVGTVVLDTAALDAAGNTRTPPIILFQALPKGEKMDIIVRQAAEGGITEIVPFVSEFSAVKIEKGTNAAGKHKFSRWERIIKEARQQSGSTTATIIRQPVSTDGLLEYWERMSTQRPDILGLLFHHTPLANVRLHQYLGNNPEAVVLVIGPEGGFSAAEAERFIAAGFKPFMMEGTILRTETAALYAQAAVRILLLEQDSWKMK